MSYRRRENWETNRRKSKLNILLNSKSKIFEWRGNIWSDLVLVENDNFDPRRRNVKKISTVNDDQFEELKQEVKMNWFECSRSLTRSRVSPRSGAVRGNLGFGPKPILGWPSEGHGYSEAISFKPQNRQPKNLTPIRKKSRHQTPTKILIYQK